MHRPQPHRWHGQGMERLREAVGETPSEARGRLPVDLLHGRKQVDVRELSVYVDPEFYQRRILRLFGLAP